MALIFSLLHSSTVMQLAVYCLVSTTYPVLTAPFMLNFRVNCGEFVSLLHSSAVM